MTFESNSLKQLRLVTWSQASNIYIVDIEHTCISAPPPPSTPTQQVDSGLAPPPPPEGQTPEDGEEAELDGELAIEEPVEQDDSAKPKKVWMDFMEFCKCFK